MKRLIFAVIGIFLFVGVVSALQDSIYERSRVHETVGWSVHVEDNDIDLNTQELITELDTTYAQLAAEDTIEVLSSSALDITQTVTVRGIDDSGNKVSEEIALNTTAGTTAVESSTTFRYIDQAEVDIECAGVITIRRATGDTFIVSIPIGELEAGIMQHFNGQYNSYITYWGVTTDVSNTIRFELRWYPSDADCLDDGDGYKVLDRISTAETSDTVSGHILQPIKCNRGGWISVYGAGIINNQTGSVTMEGYDYKP